MNTLDLVEKLKRFVIDLGLPKTDMALFGTRCPYCGKADRIRPLDSPDALTGAINPDELETYTEYWNHFAVSDGSLGVCKFCQNPLKLGGNGQAEPLVQ